MLRYRYAFSTATPIALPAEATEVVIDVRFEGNALEMSVHDNGKGFMLTMPVEELATTGHLGLIGMCERARLSGGALTIQSQPRLGTKILVTVPGAPKGPAENAEAGRRADHD